jgi:hypothetical protein
VTLVDDTDLVDIDRISTHYLGSPYGQRDRGGVADGSRSTAGMRGTAGTHWT